MRRFLAVILVFAAPFLLRAESGRDAIVIYNTRVPESKAVADYYAKRREVPANQIFGFALSTNEDMTRAEFSDSFERPLAKLLEERKLWHIASDILPGTNGQAGRVIWRPKESKFRYAVLCYGVPLRIKEDPTVKEKIEESLRPELRRNGAAVDNELALLPCIEENLPLTAPFGNPFYTTTNAAVFNPTNGVLMVARLDGPSADIARGLVDKAIEAETNGLWGRGYFDARGIKDTNYIEGDNWIIGAAEICKHLGFETTLDENPDTFPADFPMSQTAFYCGWYAENANGPFANKDVEFMPGAFAYHLHSFSASTIRSTTQRWVGPLLAKGATCTMGSVDEPYLSGTPNVAVFCSRLIYSGFSFGEAAYASQIVLSWQTTVVGDPLYRPYGKPAEVLHAELARRNSPYVAWSLLRLVNLNLIQGKRAEDMSNFLEQLDLTRQSAVLTEKLAELYSTEGKPASAIEMYERALKLSPSPLQRIRLRLTLAEKLIAANREADAAEDYRALLAESPEYPGKASVEEKLKGLKEKLAKVTRDAPATAKP